MKNSRPKRLVVHVGMPKTGSTAIQQSLSRQSLPSGFVYPNFGDFNHTFGLIDAFADDPGKVRAQLNRTIAERQLLKNSSRIRALLERLAGSPDIHTMILSAEGFQRLGDEGVKNLREFFRAFGFHIEAYGYIRAPFDFLPANFQEHLKVGPTTLSRVRTMVAYGAWVARHKRHFAADEFNLVAYERSKFPNGNIVSDFAVRIGMSGFVPIENKSNTNMSLSVQAVKLLYVFREKTGAEHPSCKPNRQHRLFVSKLHELDGDRFRFSPDFVQELINEQKEAVEAIGKAIGANLLEVVTDRPEFISSESELVAYDAVAHRWLARELGEVEQSTMTVDDWRNWATASMQALYDRFSDKKNTPPDLSGA